MYREYVNLLNLGLSNRELDVLGVIVRIDHQWPAILGAKHVLSTSCRASIQRDTLVKSSNLAAYTRKFKSRGILLRGNNDEWHVNPKLMYPLRKRPNENALEIIHILDIVKDE